jgi:hypothetical protein
MLAWFALYSDTNGFVGYIKEEFDKHPRLLDIENGDIIMKEHTGKELRLTLPVSYTNPDRIFKILSASLFPP